MDGTDWADIEAIKVLMAEGVVFEGQPPPHRTEDDCKITLSVTGYSWIDQQALKRKLSCTKRGRRALTRLLQNDGGTLSWI